MAAVQQPRRARRKGPPIGRFVFLALIVLFVLVPLYWVFVTSIKPSDDYLATPPVWTVSGDENGADLGRSVGTAGDTNGDRDIFRHDRITGFTIRVSVTTGGNQADDGSSDAVISGDGQFANTVLNKVVDFVRLFRQVQLVNYEIEMY